MAKLSISWLLISFMCFVLISKVQNSKESGVSYVEGPLEAGSERGNGLNGPNEGFGGQNGGEWEEEGGRRGNGRQGGGDYDSRHYNRGMDRRPPGERYGRGGRPMGEGHGRGGRRGRPYGEPGGMDDGPRSMSK